MADIRCSRILRTTGYHGYSVKFSPFENSLLAVASSENFGVKGCGCLIIINLAHPEDGVIKKLHWKDALYDLTWSESSPHHIVSASGDGTLQMWDIKTGKEPLAIYHEHQKEAYSIDWNQTHDRQVFASASWDTTVKIWDPVSTFSLLTLSGHKNLVYQAVFSPLISGAVASVSGDGTFKVWDMRAGCEPVMDIPVHDKELLSCDWCKYDENLLAVASTAGIVHGFDLRQPTSPMFILEGHTSAIRKLRFSPFYPTQIVTVSYDFSTRLWNYMQPSSSTNIFETHAEFVYGLDCSNLEECLFVDCAWDQTVGVYRRSSADPPCLS